MNSIFYSVIILLLLTGAILFLMWEVNKKRPGGKIVNLNQTEPMTKEEGEDHFSVLMNSITPVWYWRVNHEYIDFLHATIKRMTMTELNETPGLFDAQRRCSDLTCGFLQAAPIQKRVEPAFFALRAESSTCSTSIKRSASSPVL